MHRRVGSVGGAGGNTGMAGGSVGGVAFDVTPGTSISRYQLNSNELAKLGAVAYA